MTNPPNSIHLFGSKPRFGRTCLKTDISHISSTDRLMLDVKALLVCVESLAHFTDKPFSACRDQVSLHISFWSMIARRLGRLIRLNRLILFRS